MTFGRRLARQGARSECTAVVRATHTPGSESPHHHESRPLAHSFTCTTFAGGKPLK